MKKFSFSLEKVLDFKQQTLEIMKSELASLQLKLHAMDDQIEEMEVQFSAFNAHMQIQMQEGLSSKEIAVYKTYLSVLNSNTQKLKRMRKQLSDAIDQKKQEVLAAKSSISGFEKLKDKQWDEYNRTAQKLQEAAIEEFVSQVRSRRSIADE